MFFRRFFFAVLFGLLLIIGFSGMRHKSGFAQGYESGYAAAARDFAAETNPESDGPAQSAPASPSRQNWGFFPFFGIFGFFFKFFLVFAAISVFMKLLFFGRCRHRHGHKSGHWRHHKHGRKWGRDGGSHRPESGRPQKGDSDYEKQPEDVEPDIRSY